MSSKPKPKPKSKQVSQAQHKAAVAKAVKAAKKRWEFNIIKTGNNQVNWNSNNALGGRSRTIHPVAGMSVPRSPAVTGGSEVAVTNALPRSREQYVEQDEVVGVLKGNTAFEASALDINPGLIATFPWLAQLAVLYERYAFDELVFYYKPLGSAYAANNQSGKVILCCDYDAAEATPATYRQAESMDPHADAVAYQCIELHLDPRRLNKEPKFLRFGPPPPATDVKTYDAGNVYYCVSGTPNTGDIGEIRVRYRVRLINPRLPGVAAQVTPNNSCAWYGPITGVLNNAIETPIAPVSFTENGLGAVIDGSNIRLLQGNYLVTLQVTFTRLVNDFTNFACMIATGTETIATGIDASNGAISAFATATTSVQQLGVSRYFRVTGAGLAFNTRFYVVYGGAPTAAVAFAVFIRAA